MTTNSPNPVDGDVLAHQMPSAWIIETPDNGVRYVELKKDLADRVAQGCAKEGIRVVITPLYTTPPAQPYASRKQKRNDHSKLAAEIVDNLVSTDSCDEEVTEKLILWVLNRLNKEFTTQPPQLLRPVELPGAYEMVERGPAYHTFRDLELDEDGAWLRKDEVIDALRQQGYEVKND